MWSSWGGTWELPVTRCLCVSPARGKGCFYWGLPWPCWCETGVAANHTVGLSWQLWGWCAALMALAWSKLERSSFLCVDSFSWQWSVDSPIASWETGGNLKIHRAGWEMAHINCLLDSFLWCGFYFPFLFFVLLFFFGLKKILSTVADLQLLTNPITSGI